MKTESIKNLPITRLIKKKRKYPVLMESMKDLPPLRKLEIYASMTNLLDEIIPQVQSMEKRQQNKIQKEEIVRVIGILDAEIKRLEGYGFFGEGYLEKLQGIYKEYEGISALQEVKEIILSTGK